MIPVLDALAIFLLLLPGAVTQNFHFPKCFSELHRHSFQRYTFTVPPVAPLSVPWALLPSCACNTHFLTESPYSPASRLQPAPLKEASEQSPRPVVRHPNQLVSLAHGAQTWVTARPRVPFWVDIFPVLSWGAGWDLSCHHKCHAPVNRLFLTLILECLHHVHSQYKFKVYGHPAENLYFNHSVSNCSSDPEHCNMSFTQLFSKNGASLWLTIRCAALQISKTIIHTENIRKPTQPLF